MTEFSKKNYGLRKKSGLDRIPLNTWQQITDFIKGRSWDFPNPCLPEDNNDPLLNKKTPYGSFMLGFDFHITPLGPRLIEINTNAGGLATVFALSSLEFEKKLIKENFVHALLKEYQLAGKNGHPGLIAIVDDKVREQNLYPEMLAFAEILENHRLKAIVLSPEEIQKTEKGLSYQNNPIDFIYNRLTDFRLTEPEHLFLREASLGNQIVLSPHPASYVRIADKRNLLRLKHPIALKAYLFKDKPLEEWMEIRKNWVFKPPNSAGSKGVYRGDKISAAKLASLPPDTVVQEYAEPFRNEDGSKQDLRVYTRDTEILGIASRHFSGQVMEMHSEKSGFRAILPDNTCCFPMVLDQNFCIVNPETGEKISCKS